MSKLAAVALVVVAAGCAEDVPSCQQALTHYYGAQCIYRNGETGQNISRDEMIAACQQIAAEIPARCQDVFDDWVTCNAEVAGVTNAGCDCSGEFQALLVCGS